MRRPVHARVLIAAGLVLAACSPDSAVREPLAPTEPSLAAGTLCSGSLASDIAKQQKLIYSGSALTTIEASFKIIKNGCPNANAQLMTYLQQTIDLAPAPTSATKAGQITTLWSMVIKFHDDVLNFTRPASVLQGQGGADVLSPTSPVDLEMATWDGLAALKIDANSMVNGENTLATPRLFTFAPATSLTECPSSSLALTGRCYHVEVYPPATDWTPKVTVGLCPLFHGQGTQAVGHDDEDFGTEVLPSGGPYPAHCGQDESAMNTWLGREAGPVGRAVARAYDYLRPRPLFAVDAGESGLLGEFSLVGGVLPIVFDDNFDNEPVGPFVDGTPTIGTSWDVTVAHPGYIEIQNGFGSLTGPVVVLSQALGNCAACPVVSLIGTRTNQDTTETIGSYEITWSALQAKPSVKEAAFIVRANNDVEIARVSFVTVGPANQFTYNGNTVLFGGNPVTWEEDVHDDFRLTVNLDTKSGTDWTTQLAIKINGVFETVATGSIAVGSNLKSFGFYLDGIDAGIIAADKFTVRRLTDN